MIDHPDHLITPRLVADATGTTVWRWDQAEPFGANPANDDPDGNSVTFDLPLRLPGQRYDAETGLHYNYFRDYDPSLGRYGESDPIGLRGGLNTYAYVGGTPLLFSDPDGLQYLPFPGFPTPPNIYCGLQPELCAPPEPPKGACYVACVAVKTIAGQLLVEGAKNFEKSKCRVVKLIGTISGTIARVGRNPVVMGASGAFALYACFEVCDLQCCDGDYGGHDDQVMADASP